MNEKTQKDALADLQAKSDGLPAGTVIGAPVTCQVCGTDPCNAVNHHFGVCPICHRTDGYMNVGNEHWFVCNEHKTKWVIGANLFSSCMDETPEQQRAEQEKIGFAGYEKVEPHYDTAGADEECGGCHCFRCEGSDVKDVDFNDPEMMRITSDDEFIEEFLTNYPYLTLRWICRKLNLTPAETLKRLKSHIKTVDNGVWTPEEGEETLIREVEGEIERGWEPGIKPAPITDEALAGLVAEHVRCDFNTSRDWSVADLAHRSGRDAEDVVAATIQMCIGHVLSHFKYTQFDQQGDECKWLLSPTEIAEAAINCDWIKTAHRRMTEADFMIYKTADGDVGYTDLEPEKEK